MNFSIIFPQTFSFWGSMEQQLWSYPPFKGEGFKSFAWSKASKKALISMSIAMPYPIGSKKCVTLLRKDVSKSVFWSGEKGFPGKVWRLQWGDVDFNNREKPRFCGFVRLWRGGVGLVVGAFEESCGVGGFQGFHLKDEGQD